MDWNWYLFSFQGRINRAKWWLSVLVIFGWMLFLLWATSFVEMIVVKGQSVTIDIGIDSMFALMGRAVHLSLSRIDMVPLVANFLGFPVLLWICLATSVKRLHDRDWSGWWIVPFLVVPMFSGYVEDWLSDSILSMPFGLAVIILGGWGFVEMGFRKGTPRTNLFGPSPLPKMQARPRKTVFAKPYTKPDWDQQAEIEFVPPHASPPAGMHVKRGA
jgi:uncharacterized membrane protein YhaH (DUF805 family)